MPRLDIWLVENGYAPSRQIAKRMIKEGHISIVGKKVKPSTFVQESDSIQISDDVSMFPIGYKKLQMIDHIMGGNIIQPGDKVLDIGSSAGGFLLYSSEKGAQSIGIEISQRFFEALRNIERDNDNISVIFDDAFTINTSRISNLNELDIILIDVTTSVSGTIKLIEKYLELLKPDGRIIASLKTNDEIMVKKHMEPILNELKEYKFLTINPDKDEIHLIAICQ
jgi:23S rRNA (cytidine1920-2'-O)/16S rRNA (cytidine1409-2'-O)-methyltransferase